MRQKPPFLEQSHARRRILAGIILSKRNRKLGPLSIKK